MIMWLAMRLDEDCVEMMPGVLMRIYPGLCDISIELQPIHLSISHTVDTRPLWHTS